MNKVLLTIIGCFAAVLFAAAQPDTTTITRVGDKAPVFTCRTIDGKTIDISKLQGKIIMINFFATWCGPCLQELPVLQKTIWDKYKSNDNFQLIILGRQHNETEVRKFVDSRKFTMPFAPDPERKIYSLYATQFIPRNVIIGKDGKIIFQSMGYTPEEFKKIEDLLSEKLKLPKP